MKSFALIAVVLLVLPGGTPLTTTIFYAPCQHPTGWFWPRICLWVPFLYGIPGFPFFATVTFLLVYAIGKQILYLRDLTHKSAQ